MGGPGSRRALTSRIVWVAAATLSLAASESQGDILRFREGGEVVASATQQGAVVVIDTPMGEFRFPIGDFREVVATNDPRADWAAKVDEARRGDAAKKCATAIWALDHGLVPEAGAMIREAHEQDAGHQPSARMVAALDRLATPLPDPAMPKILRGLPVKHKIARGPHVVLVHQHSDADSSERVAILETIVEAYALHFASLGLDLASPRERLASMWFARKADYLAFLRAEGATSFLNTRGYHDAVRNMVVAYDCRDDPARLRARTEGLEARAELAAFASKVDAIPAAGRARVTLRGKPHSVDRGSARELLSALGRELDRRDIVLELGRREIDWGVAAHETIHQLVAVTRLAPQHNSFPSALSEGLAMQFEAISGGRWAGLAGVPTFRLRDYRALKGPPGLASTIGDSKFGPGYNPDTYARAWATIRYLRTDRPEAFVSLIDRLRSPSDRDETAASRALRVVASLLPEGEDGRFREAINQLRLPSEPTNPAAHPH